MKNIVKKLARPKLNNPNLLAAWPGVGNVAMIVTSYLTNKLNFKDLAIIDPSYFFDPTGVLVEDSIIEAPQFPQSRFYYRKNDHRGGNDLILFIGDDQPSSKSYALAHTILDVAESFNVHRTFTCAAALTRIHHTEQPKVWGVGTNKGVVDELSGLNLKQKGNLQIAGLNGLLLGVAKERGMDGLCLLGEVPSYASRMPNPMASLAVLRILAPLLDLEIDLGEMRKIADETSSKMKEAAAEAMGQYIDYFTQPIWEQGQDEFGEDYDDFEEP
jgi:uncharacterized protein